MKKLKKIKTKNLFLDCDYIDQYNVGNLISLTRWVKNNIFGIMFTKYYD